jgi:GTP cyclohydrolase I
MTDELDLQLYIPEAEDDAANLLASLPGWYDVAEHHRVETPKRMVAMLTEMMMPTDYDEKFKVFPNQGCDEMVVVGPIPFYTLCAHHVVPFYGNAYVGYVPRRYIAGLSKFARVVKGVAKGLWVQEELTQTIANYLEDKLQPLGVAVVIRAEHMCMAMRGVEVANVLTTTSSMKGVFSDHNRTAKAEFLAWIRP